MADAALYGLNAGIPNESFQTRPFNEYGKSKLQAEEAFWRWAEEDPARSLVIVRPAVILGEGNRGNVYNLLSSFYHGGQKVKPEIHGLRGKHLRLLGPCPVHGPRQARRVWVRMRKWQSVNRKEVRFVLNLQWFRKLGLIFLHDFTQRNPEPLLFSR